MTTTRERVRAADAAARDAIAERLDRALAGIPTVRTISARLLTRSPARDGGNTAQRTARDLQLPRYALTSRIQRRGGASMSALRDEIVLTRLAFCFRDRDATWPLAAEILGVVHLSLLRRIVRRRRRLAPGRWRLSITPDKQLRALEDFLAANAPRWHAAMRVKDAA